MVSYIILFFYLRVTQIKKSFSKLKVLRSDICTQMKSTWQQHYDEVVEFNYELSALNFSIESM